MKENPQVVATGSKEKTKWQFWVDRGGTFTDIVAIRSDGKQFIHKLLSECPERYTDATIQGIRDILGLDNETPLPYNQISTVKMGTTLATNALLEKKGERTLFVTTKGFADALRIAYQNRPQVFAKQIILPEMLYDCVIEVDERFTAKGKELQPVDTGRMRAALKNAYDKGIRSCAIVLMHGYKYTDHEKIVARIASEVGFTHISTSHQVSPLMKFVSRGDTTVIDAYLSPKLQNYIDGLMSQLGSANLLFMQSNGGLAEARYFHGKDSILSGPAGGIVGAVKTSLQENISKIVSFDMGGTSTDVAHFNGDFERTYESEIAGVRIRAPMMSIHTIAAGGGSIIKFDGERFTVGPESAGANPGPACYRKGGPLTITDCNVMIGKIQEAFFPKVFGNSGDQPIDVHIVKHRFAELSHNIYQATGISYTCEQIASGFLSVAIEHMASAIKKISVQRGHDLTDYTLCCFGGAGGQHALSLADALGIKQVFIHAYAGVLSAYGMGLAEMRVMKETAIESPLNNQLLPLLKETVHKLSNQATQDLRDQGVHSKQIRMQIKAHLRYTGTNSTLSVQLSSVNEMITEFEAAHRLRYGYHVSGREIIVETIVVETEGMTQPQNISRKRATLSDSTQPLAVVQMYTEDKWHQTPVFHRYEISPGKKINGPAILIEPTGTNVIEPGWQAKVTDSGNLILNRVQPRLVSPTSTNRTSQIADPVMLEIFNNLFMSIAEEMGITLQNTSSSVNIKERMDFSCAIFDGGGLLVANAPHIPVHLGSMSESVQSILQARKHTIHPGDVFMLNTPYNGGTHLPDITVISPVFAGDNSEILFFVASRGHHADIGGITPGSMPPYSKSIEEEGVLIDNFKLVDQGQLRESEIIELLSSGPFPVRNIAESLADLRAQIASNKRGVQELHKLINVYGLDTVRQYMLHVQNNAESAMRKVIRKLHDGSFAYCLDDNSTIKVAIKINQASGSAHIDFTGTSQQVPTNFNAPPAVCRAAVLYVFRTLVDHNIPLNAGCLRPLTIEIPPGSMLNPNPPSAVVAGNVETSQVITDALYGALGIMSAAQGTMNNFTFGNEQYQYYETICGGSGASSDFDGIDAIHTHMTNSRLTDPEILEWRFPVLLESFTIRPNSGGTGKHSGGNGIVRRIRFLEPMTAAILSNRRVVPPFGLHGGHPGKLGLNLIQRQNGTIELLGGTAIAHMNAEDVFIIKTPGGGGWGNP